MKQIFAPLSRSSLALVLLALGGLSLTGCKNESAQAAPEAVEAAIAVPTSAASTMEIAKFLQLTGNLEGKKQANLAANVAGRVLKVEVERGDHVKKGDIIARVDVKAAQLALAEAQVNVSVSETQASIDEDECERYESLHKKGVVSEQQYDQVMARCKTAPLQLKAAQARQHIAAKNVGDGTIRAPFDGIVTDVQIEEGEYVQSSTSVIGLAQEDTLKVIFSVPERDIPKVLVKAPIKLQVQAYDQSFEGVVTQLSGAVRATRDMIAEAQVDNPEGLLMPGMFAEVRVESGQEKVVAVPTAAVFQQNGKPNVLVKKEGRLYQRVVQTLAAQGDKQPLRSGVEEGEQVVSPYKPEYENGMKVK